MFYFPDYGAVAGAMGTLIFWGLIVTMILGLALGPRYIRSRERQKLYDLMRTAYEKGQPVPPELIASLTSEPVEPDAAAAPYRGAGADHDLRRAVVLIAVGLGLGALGLMLGAGIGIASQIGGAITGGVIAGAGAIPAFIGLAYLLLYLAGRKAPPRP
jgi:Domain of unknown function (DUF6249)